MKIKIHIQYFLDRRIGGTSKCAKLTLEFPKEFIEAYRKEGTDGPLHDFQWRILKVSSLYDIIDWEAETPEVKITGETWEKIDREIRKYISILKLFLIPEDKEIELEI
jgi:hypothetical protein